MDKEPLKYSQSNKEEDIDKMEMGYCVRCGKPVVGRGVMCKECLKDYVDEGDGTEYTEYSPHGKSSQLGKDPAPAGHENEEPVHGDK